MTQHWGDFCTYCGVPISGDFPRQCDNRHVTYASPVTVGIALQPVQCGERVGVLAVQRGIAPYKGQYALPGGFADHGETAIISAPRELSEETPLRPNSAVRYFSEAIGSSHNTKDMRCHAMYFYAVPIVQEQAIAAAFNNDEVQSLAVLFLSQAMTLETRTGTTITLCLDTHQAAAVAFLKSIN